MHFSSPWWKPGRWGHEGISWSYVQDSLSLVGKDVTARCVIPATGSTVLTVESSALQDSRVRRGLSKWQRFWSHYDKFPAGGSQVLSGRSAFFPHCGADVSYRSRTENKSGVCVCCVSGGWCNGRRKDRGGDETWIRCCRCSLVGWVVRVGSEQMTAVFSVAVRGLWENPACGTSVCSPADSSRCLGIPTQP